MAGTSELWWDITKMEHSHIHGLGLDGRLGPSATSRGIFDRKVTGMILKMAQEGRIVGRAMLFAEPSSTGKTTIALDMAQTLGQDVSPTVIAASASNVFSSTVSKTEPL
ncbi:TIP49 C-terminus-domain-containing protein [Armillaria fumosa]|nr:TIP49 C-terminus-domain-containing protein [Armillaria fumosa]